MLAHPGGVHGGEGHLLVDADVAADEQRRRIEVGVVGVVETEGVVRQVIAGAGLEVPLAVEGAQSRGAGGVGAVDGGAVDVGGVLVVLLPDAVLHHVERARGRDHLGAGALRVEGRVALGHGDVELLVGALLDEREVVVHELAPLPEHVAGIDGVVGRRGLRLDGVADGARAGAVGAARRGDAVAVAVGLRPQLGEARLAGGAPGRVRQVVVGAVDGTRLEPLHPGRRRLGRALEGIVRAARISREVGAAGAITRGRRAAATREGREP